MDHNISLPDDAHAWVAAEASEGDFPSVDAFVLSLVDRARERKDGIAKLKVLLAEAEASGICEESVDEIFDKLRRRRRKNG